MVGGVDSAKQVELHTYVCLLIKKEREKERKERKREKRKERKEEREKKEREGKEKKKREKAREINIIAPWANYEARTFVTFLQLDDASLAHFKWSSLSCSLSLYVRLSEPVLEH